ncbi:hypothetical protein B0T19DRAFT_89597 [Cercophora scortea]|uniref:Secreted protein n=1 Tax=Cercophora scortea TaxID=314031 RepID=A0AAE0IVY0_9PEZI|nr:hypothetical protein B0T19DRAFT_89597 [Cercophora scortea]
MMVTVLLVPRMLHSLCVLLSRSELPWPGVTEPDRSESNRIEPLVSSVARQLGSLSHVETDIATRGKKKDTTLTKISVMTSNRCQGWTRYRAA